MALILILPMTDIQKLRTSIIPEIINHYSKDKIILEPCFNNSNDCNKLVHIHINNYDLPFVATPPKRIYKYDLLPIYYDKYEDIKPDILQKIFSTYCESITGEITKHYYTPTYLGSNILHLGNEIKLNIPDLNSILEVEMEPNSVNFKKIIDTLKSFSNYNPKYISPKKYDSKDYFIIEILTKI